MAQMPSAARYSSGVYEWLADREERAAAAKDSTLPWTDEQPSYTGRPERLSKLRAGLAVNVAVSELPRYARLGLDGHWWNRATVEPSGAIELTIDAGEWAAEQGL
ncbi:MAG: hypothetical protein JWR34_4322 [Mycobacterium sp.]|nr:hypothetical protein [Mycobacterium sp.]